MRRERRSIAGAFNQTAPTLAGALAAGVVAAAAALGGWWAAWPAHPAAAQAPVPPQQPQAQVTTLLSELATRLLVPLGAQQPPVQLLPGQVAPEVPLELGAPPGGRIVGSAVRSSGPEGPSSVEVVLDAPGTPGDAQRFYEQSFGRQGWSPQAAGPGGSPRGFQPSVPPPTFTPFCRSAAGPWLLLGVAGRPNAPADVRVRVELRGGGPCATPPSGPVRGQEPPGAALLPALYAPAGMPVELTGGGPGPRRFGSDATVVGEVPPTDLEAHFARQLQAAGWTRRDGAAQSALAWSTWTVPGTAETGEVQGFLYVLAAPGSGQRALHVEVLTANLLAGPGGGLGGEGGVG
jgi:hypothetical protein